MLLLATWMRVFVAQWSGSLKMEKSNNGKWLNRSQKDYNCLRQLAKPNSIKFNRVNIEFLDPAHLLPPGPERESMYFSGPMDERKLQEVAQHRAWHIIKSPKMLIIIIILITHY